MQLHGGGHRSIALWQYHDLHKYQVEGQAFSGHEQFTFVGHLSKEELHYTDRCESEIITVFPVQGLQNLTKTQVFDILVKHGICVKKQDSLPLLFRVSNLMTIAQPVLIITQSFNTWTVVSNQKQAVKEWQLLGQKVLVTKEIQLQE